MAVGDSLGPAVQRHSLTAIDLPAAAAALGHAFADPELLREALTHRSAAPSAQAVGSNAARPPQGAGSNATRPPQGAGSNATRPPKGTGSNERMEFIGDRVLGLLIAEWLIARFPHEQEGELGQRLGHLVSQPVLATIAEEIGLGGIISVSPGEARVGVKRLATVLADAMEAVIGAIYLDGGLDAARRFVREGWATTMEAQRHPPKDAKTALQEWAQGRGHALPLYVVAATSGPSHAPEFIIEVSVAGQTGRGVAGAKRLAEQLAAQSLLDRLRDVTRQVS